MIELPYMTEERMEKNRHSNGTTTENNTKDTTLF